jgi:hypothetical protein
MTEHPVFIPTSAGPLGAIVTEPTGPERVAVVIVEPSADFRFGVNQLWARTARDLADLGAVVLRADHVGRGESATATPEAPDPGESLREATEWFRSRTADLDGVYVGHCLGAQIAAGLARADERPAGLAMLTPQLRPMRGAPVERRLRDLYLALRLHRLRAAMGVSIPRRLAYPRLARDEDEGLVGAVVEVAGRASVYCLFGDHDPQAGEAWRLRSPSGDDGNVRVEIVPGVNLHHFRSLSAQRESRSRVVGWVGRLLEERDRSPDPRASSSTQGAG